MYEISDYALKKAKELGVKIMPSTRKNKKIDVIDGDKVYSIGDIRYKDYQKYIKEKGKEYANVKRELFYKRHGKAFKTKKDYFSKVLLW